MLTDSYTFVFIFSSWTSTTDNTFIQKNNILQYYDFLNM